MTTTLERTQSTLTVRRPQIDFSDSPKYWVLGDPQTTHSLNLLHFGIPAGERYFIDSVKLATKYIEDKTLLADARAFIGQEAVHARLHEQAAEHLGLFDIPEITRRIDLADRARERLYQRIDNLAEPFRKRAVLVFLSTTMLGEHFTALFADLSFDPAKIDRASIDPEMNRLLGWHAAEEMEHRTLPYDIYEHLGGGYVTRIAPLALTMFALPFGLIALTDRMMRGDPELEGGFSLRDHVRAVRAKRSFNLVDVMARLPRYFRPGYHPSHAGDDRRAREFLANELADLFEDSEKSATN